MSRRPFAVLLGGLILAVGFAPAAPTQTPSNAPHPKETTPAKDGPDKKFPDFDKLVKGAKEYDGLFKLHQKEDHLFAEIRPDQLDRPLLAPVAIARGMGLGGFTLNFDEQWVLVFKRVGDKVQVIRRNVRFQAKKDAPVARAVETTYHDSVLLAVPIKSINPQKQSVVIDLNDVFLTDFADLGMGEIDPNRTTWHKVKAFPRNVELQVAATFKNPGRGMTVRGDDSVIDPRGRTLVVHYSLVELPDGYQPRLADDRVGHFLTAVKDFTSDNRDSSYLRYVNRWRLERADGSTWKEGGKLVPPKKKIIFWIEKSVPDEYRAAVREGILEWNKAFEKVGFRDAIEVRQQEGEDFDPEDVNYNTFRWITSDAGFAMGPSRANPLTGEIIDADIIFDASMVRYYKIDQQIFKSSRGLPFEAASPIQAAREGWSLLRLPFDRGPDRDATREPRGWNDRPDPAAMMRARVHAVRSGFCQCAAHKQTQLGLALMALQLRAGLKPGDKMPDEMIQQAVKEVTMHEVGHTLGLRHNFKASTMLKNADLHNTAVTRKQGLVGSVMDYSPVNLAPKGVQQGDFFTTTLGPYDYWAIEYAYRPISGGTESELPELQKIAAKCAAPGLSYGTDEDMFGTSDPLVNVWDLGADPMKFATDRMLLAEELMKGLADRVVEKGEGYQRARMAFTMLLWQYGDAAYLTSQFVGGEYYHRDHRGDPSARDPLVPVTGTRQREALKFLQSHILTDRPFQFPPEVLRKLAADRWMHWGNDYSLFSGVEYPLNERVLSIQRVVLGQLLSGSTLARIQNNALKSDRDDQPLTPAEVFRSLTDGVFADLPNGDKPAAKSSVVRRNLQREYLKRLAGLTLGPKSRASMFDGPVFVSFDRPAPPDARSLARMHLKDVARKIDWALADKKGPPDDTVRAHLEECKEQIAKVLAAGVQVNEP